MVEAEAIKPALRSSPLDPQPLSSRTVPVPELEAVNVHANLARQDHPDPRALPETLDPTDNPVDQEILDLRASHPRRRLRNLATRSVALELLVCTIFN